MKYNERKGWVWHKNFYICFNNSLLFEFVPILGKMDLKNLYPFGALFIRSFVINSILLIAGIATGQFKDLLIRQPFYFHALNYSKMSQIVPAALVFPLIVLVLSMLFLYKKTTALNALNNDKYLQLYIKLFLWGRNYLLIFDTFDKACIILSLRYFLTYLYVN